MQVRTDLTPPEIREAARLMRPKNFWLKFLLASWYATALLLVAIAIFVMRAVQHLAPNWSAIGICLALAAFRYGISWTRWTARQTKAIEAVKPTAGTRTLESTGIRTTLANGASSFVPWSSCTKWVGGESVFVVTGSAGTTILPVEQGTRESLRGLLQSYIAGA